VELNRENPLGYAFLALAHLFSDEMGFDPQEKTQHQEDMLQDIGEALARGLKRIEKNPRDSQAYFAMAIAKIVKVRWAIAQKRYVMVAQETANIWDYLEKVKAEDPQNYDVYFPIGLLHYHLDHLPAVTRFFSSLLITAADRQKGLQELVLAAQKGDLLKELAQAELSSVYTYFEGQPAQALPITLELKNKFPRNYNFLFALANTLSELQRFTEAFAVAREIETGIQAGRPPFVPQLQPRLDHLLGKNPVQPGGVCSSGGLFPEGPHYGPLHLQCPQPDLGSGAPGNDSRHPPGKEAGGRVLYPCSGGGGRGRNRPDRGEEIHQDTLYASSERAKPLKAGNRRWYVQSLISGDGWEAAPPGN
jgi:hypothetical protein